MKLKILGFLVSIFVLCSVTAFAECTADVNVDMEVKITWDVQEAVAGKPMVIWLEKNDVTEYANMLMPEEYSQGEIILRPEGLIYGDVLKVTLTGSHMFSKEITFDANVYMDTFKYELDDLNEQGIFDLIVRYENEINYSNMNQIKALTEEEEIQIVEEAVLNEQFSSFQELSAILDSAYQKILHNRNEAISGNSRPTGGGGGSREQSFSFKGNIQNDKTSNVVEQPPVDVNEREERFTDLEQAEWAKESIYYLYDRSIVSGTGEATFSPLDNVTRAQFVTMLVRAFGIETNGKVSDFADVATNYWAYPYISAACSVGVVSGVSETEFSPESPITRQDAAVMVYRFCDKFDKKLTIGANMQFNDVNLIAEYAKTAVEVINAAGIMVGNDGYFEPTGMCTRAMAARIIHQVLEIGG